MMDDVFFDDYSSLGRILIVAPVAYVGLVLMLRISGKRTLTKLNAFDLVITVALGSTLSSAILSATTPLLDGLLALAALIGLQWAVSAASVRSKAVRRLVRSEPTVLARDGALRREAMRRERITESDVVQALRAHGLRGVEHAEIVLLQTDGSIAVTRKND